MSFFFLRKKSSSVVGNHPQSHSTSLFQLPQQHQIDYLAVTLKLLRQWMLPLHMSDLIDYSIVGFYIGGFVFFFCIDV